MTDYGLAFWRLKVNAGQLPARTEWTAAATFRSDFGSNMIVTTNVSHVVSFVNMSCFSKLYVSKTAVIASRIEASGFTVHSAVQVNKIWNLLLELCVRASATATTCMLESQHRRYFAVRRLVASCHIWCFFSKLFAGHQYHQRFKSVQGGLEISPGYSRIKSEKAVGFVSCAGWTSPRTESFHISHPVCDRAELWPFQLWEGQPTTVQRLVWEVLFQIAHLWREFNSHTWMRYLGCIG